MKEVKAADGHGARVSGRKERINGLVVKTNVDRGKKTKTGRIIQNGHDKGTHSRIQFGGPSSWPGFLPEC